MRAYIIQTVKHVSKRSGAETLLTMYCANDQIEDFYAMLGEDRSIVDSKVVLYRPTNCRSYKSTL